MNITIEHFFFDILKFAFREIVKNKVIFQAIND